MGNPIGRTVAAVLGLFALANLRGAENLWWIDVRPLPGWILAFPGVVLIAHALWPQRCMRVVVATVGLLMTVSMVNTARFWNLDLQAASAVPFTVLVTGLLALILKSPATSRPGIVAVGTLGILAVGLPLAQAWFFGRTDYRRPADAIVVFGARTYADGRPSDALADRVRTGCELYLAGYAPRLLFSGGPGDGAFHETDAMRELALALGVPDEAIEIDRSGLNTEATVAHSGSRRVLVVSHFWHLPRVKMTYRRAGIPAYTVPARERYIIRQTPYLMLRETAAFWWYWARGV